MEETQARITKLSGTPFQEMSKLRVPMVKKKLARLRVKEGEKLFWA